MYLFINTANNENIFLALLDKKGDILIQKNIKAKYQQLEKLLKNIDALLGAGFQTCGPRKATGKDASGQLCGIICVIGPGGFTSLRIGIATCNAMAWALDIPIIGVNNLTEIKKSIKLIAKQKKFKKQILPEYGKEPNITIEK